MWGICYDVNTYPDMYGLVIEYKLLNQDRAFVILPKNGYQLNPKEIKKLPEPPKYIYGQEVCPCNHPEMTGIISEIYWHFKKNCYYYKIQIGKKLKSKRYFDNDLKQLKL